VLRICLSVPHKNHYGVSIRFQVVVGSGGWRALRVFKESCASFCSIAAGRQFHCAYSRDNAEFRSTGWGSKKRACKKSRIFVETFCDGEKI
jgi:hypothetical protein